MKVYFTASLFYKEKFADVYKRIINKLFGLGYKVEASHLIKHTVAEVHTDNIQQRLKGYKEILDWIREADVVVCEVSFPSTITNGHVMTRALEQGKPVLALYKERSLPPLLLGLELERFRMAEYNKENLEEVLEREITELVKLPDERFTMLLPKNIIHHLNEIAKTGISRSEYIRNLIKSDIRKSKRKRK